MGITEEGCETIGCTICIDDHCEECNISLCSDCGTKILGKTVTYDCGHTEKCKAKRSLVVVAGEAKAEEKNKKRKREEGGTRKNLPHDMALVKALILKAKTPQLKDVLEKFVGDYKNY
jgi:hypothetical protein